MVPRQENDCQSHSLQDKETRHIIEIRCMFATRRWKQGACGVAVIGNGGQSCEGDENEQRGIMHSTHTTLVLLITYFHIYLKFQRLDKYPK